MPDNAVSIFISYSHKDDEWRQKLDIALASLKREGLVSIWHDRRILPGQEWKGQIDQYLETSDIILLLVSFDFINSDYCYDIEMTRAIERHDANEAIVIPIIIRYCDWEPSPFGKCQALPKDAKPIKSWSDQDEAFLDVVKGIRAALKSFLKRPGKAAPATTVTSQPKSAPIPVVVKEEPSSKSMREGFFEYITVRVDESGEIVERAVKQAPLIIEDLGGGINIELVEIPGGEFWMGSTEADAQTAFTEAKRRYKDAQESWYQAETPRHRVKVSAFLMGRYQVTQSQWYEVMGDLPQIEEKLRGDDRPVVNVSWEQASEFCQELTRRTGHQYRLPTEAEWEYACRAGTNTAFAFGPTLSPEVANYWWSAPYGNGPSKEQLGRTVEVGSVRVANGFGLSDMHGNVWEWCLDWYGEKYYEECRKQGVVVDPQGPAAGSGRVDRGGGWGSGAVVCRSADRNTWASGNRSSGLGFRLVRIGR